MLHWLKYVGVGLLAFLLGPLGFFVLGKAGVVYGIAIVALYLAGRSGREERAPGRSALAGVLTMILPALAAGLPARWVVEYYEGPVAPWEQVRISLIVFIWFLLLGALVGLTGRLLPKRQRDLVP